MKNSSYFDRIVMSIMNNIRGPRSFLSSYIFHGILMDKGEVEKNIIYPHQPMTVTAFRQFIEFHLEKGYRFISPHDILSGLKVPGKYALITFDDGYYNNINALEVLKEFNVPAVFFPTMNHIKQGTSFWWDIIWRCRGKQGASRKKIVEEIRSMEKKTKGGIAGYLGDAFGQKSFAPIGDIDRPFTESELKRFAMEKFVHIGNHAMDHVPLTNGGRSEIEYQITTAQSLLTELIGKEPLMISYPHGNVSDEVIRVSKQAGLKLGITVIAGKNALPIRDPFLIKRFYSLTSAGNIRWECARLDRKKLTPDA